MKFLSSCKLMKKISMTADELVVPGNRYINMLHRCLKFRASAPTFLVNWHAHDSSVSTTSIGHTVVTTHIPRRRCTLVRVLVIVKRNIHGMKLARLIASFFYFLSSD